MAVLGGDGFGTNPLSQAGWPATSHDASSFLSTSLDHLALGPLSGSAWHFHILWLLLPTGALLIWSSVATTALIFSFCSVLKPFPDAEATVERLATSQLERSLSLLPVVVLIPS